MLGRLNHVAIAVPDLAKGAEIYRTMLGATVSAPQAEPEHEQDSRAQAEPAWLNVAQPVAPLCESTLGVRVGIASVLCLVASAGTGAADDRAGVGEAAGGGLCHDCSR